MTSKERHEARYQRRNEQRREKIIERSKKYTDWDDVFGLVPLIKAYKQTSKPSKEYVKTQIWMSSLLVNSREIQIQLQENKWRSKGFNRFDIMERGKLRHIASVHISEKGIQNTLSNNCLIPILEPYMIYDNGASMKNKGTDFALDRFTKQLREHYRKFGCNGYIYFFDFKGYFQNIDTNILLDNVSRYLLDNRLFNLYKTLIDNYTDGGLNLGSQVSQISAVFYPSQLDHFIKDQLGVKGYGRYMDDGYIICDDLARLKEIVSAFERKCKELNIILNKNKCQIVRFCKQFIFLKTRFFITDTGKVVRRLNRPVSRKERNRLKAFKKFYELGLMTKEQVYLNFHSWLLSLNRGKNYHMRLNMIKYYNDLFKEFKDYMPTKNVEHKHKVLLHLAKISQKIQD